MLKNDKAAIFTGPFDEFHVRWYLVIGSALTLTIVFQMFTPHVPMLFQLLSRSIQRCYDRKLSYNDRITRQAIQSDYEKMYIGPEFML